MGLQHEFAARTDHIVVRGAVTALCCAEVRSRRPACGRSRIGLQGLLKGLLKDEAAGRKVQKQTMMKRLAGFPVIKTLDDFAKGVKKSHPWSPACFRRSAMLLARAAHRSVSNARPRRQHCPQSASVNRPAPVRHLPPASPRRHAARSTWLQSCGPAQPQPRALCAVLPCPAQAGIKHHHHRDHDQVDGPADTAFKPPGRQRNTHGPQQQQHQWILKLRDKPLPRRRLWRGTQLVRTVVCQLPGGLGIRQPRADVWCGHGGPSCHFWIWTLSRPACPSGVPASMAFV